MPDGSGPALLHVLATTILALRKKRGWTRRDLAARTGVSERFLADIETEKANPSILKLCDIAEALGTTPVALLGAALPDAVRPGEQIIALLGLRGAGKSSVGRALADRLGCAFIELDREIETATGLSLAQIFSMYDLTYYRNAEHDTLRALLTERPRPFVVATGGGLVTERATYDLLRAHTDTVWLRARPEDHWQRVIRQGDTRPMDGDERAFAALCAILNERESLYEQAATVIDTSGRDVDSVVEELHARFAAPGSGAG